MPDEPSFEGEHRMTTEEAFRLLLTDRVGPTDDRVGPAHDRISLTHNPRNDPKVGNRAYRRATNPRK